MLLVRHILGIFTNHNYRITTLVLVDGPNPICFIRDGNVVRWSESDDLESGKRIKGEQRR